MSAQVEAGPQSQQVTGLQQSRCWSCEDRHAAAKAAPCLATAEKTAWLVGVGLAAFTDCAIAIAQAMCAPRPSTEAGPMPQAPGSAVLRADTPMCHARLLLRRDWQHMLSPALTASGCKSHWSQLQQPQRTQSCQRPHPPLPAACKDTHQQVHKVSDSTWQP